MSTRRGRLGWHAGGPLRIVTDHEKRAEELTKEAYGIHLLADLSAEHGWMDLIASYELLIIAGEHLRSVVLPPGLQLRDHWLHDEITTLKKKIERTLLRRCNESWWSRLCSRWRR